MPAALSSSCFASSSFRSSVVSFLGGSSALAGTTSSVHISTQITSSMNRVMGGLTFCLRGETHHGTREDNPHARVTLSRKYEMPSVEQAGEFFADTRQHPVAG